ncbi:MAG: glycosyltransferase [Desulfatitalea sp. BRH_c12]|nr:MAG: glycosyltransferase [Desulfatitalea sp. BRH_c12]
MSISVIIVNWNSGKMLAECLRSLNSQTVLPESVYVVDNASSDGSGDFVDYSGKLKILKMSDNIGFAAGNNRGLAECTSEFVALLNPDAFPEPTWIENMLIAAREYPGIAFFGSRQLCYDDPQKVDGVGDSFHLSGLVWRKRYRMGQNLEDKIAREIFSPCAAAAMYRRQALMSVGGFDEDYFCYVEDVDLGFRLRLAGYKAMYVPDAIVRHVGSAAAGGRHSDFSVYHGHRNVVWTYVKNMPGVLFWLFMPVHILMNIVTIAIFALRGQFRVIFKSKLDAIKSLPQALIKRKNIQNRRVASIQDIWQILDKHLIPDKKW